MKSNTPQRISYVEFNIWTKLAKKEILTFHPSTEKVKMPRGHMTGISRFPIVCRGIRAGISRNDYWFHEGFPLVFRRQTASHFILEAIGRLLDQLERASYTGSWLGTAFSRVEPISHCRNPLEKLL